MDKPNDSGLLDIYIDTTAIMLGVDDHSKDLGERLCQVLDVIWTKLSAKEIEWLRSGNAIFKRCEEFGISMFDKKSN